MTPYDHRNRMFRVSRAAKYANGVRGDVSENLVVGVWGFEIWEGWR